ncbi:acyltransferase [Caulobacter segnis]|uniref:acyltransferase family protein n=1 Tax=Caulobacter segnis TaxID=88688 RepID=UPI00240F4CB2|nr:acyltransferase [Caulobacter segnis]MDG2520493.1 acyltransferase [Caulobacter segnis]
MVEAMTTGLTPERYGVLDRLRGVAALLVALYHCARVGTPQLVPSGFLAVDFFFMLSGFVIAHAYQHRLEKGMPLGWFMVLRLVRLMPVVVIASAMGAVYLILRWLASPEDSDPLWMIAGSSVINAALLPKPWIGPVSGGALFPGNGPLWSLFFEVIINAVWAIWLIRARVAVLAVLVGTAAIIFGAISVASGTTSIGWEWASFVGGLVRVTFGFGLGVLIYRLGLAPKITSRWTSLLALPALVAALMLPVQSVWWQIGLVLIVLPAILIAGAVNIGPSRVDEYLGRLSYPLYGVHVPIIFVSGGTVSIIAPSYDGAPLIFLSVAFSVLFAAIVLKLYDEPLRAFLMDKVRARRDSRVAAPTSEAAARVS